jgi:hypothetical protein
MSSRASRTSACRTEDEQEAAREDPKKKYEEAKEDFKKTPADQPG